MSKENNGGDAFPRLGSLYNDPNDKSMYYAQSTDGMSIRDYFAAKAMQAAYLLHMEGTRNVDTSAASLSSEAYAVADAMLKAREQ